MTAIWPATLPRYVTREGYTEAPVMPEYAFQPDNRQPIRRPKSTVKMHEFSCQIICTSRQLDILYDFVFERLGYGVLEFRGPHPRTRTQTRMQFLSDDDSPYTIRYRTGLEWDVNFRLLTVGR